MFSKANQNRQAKSTKERKRKREREYCVEIWNKSGIIGKPNWRLLSTGVAGGDENAPGSKERAGKRKRWHRRGRGSTLAANRCLNRPTGGQLFKRAPSVALLTWHRSTLAPGEGTPMEREKSESPGAVNCRLSRARSDRDHRRRGIAPSKPVRTHS